MLLSCRNEKYIAYCVSGYRSAIASSLLRQAGYNVVDINFGFAAVSVFAPTHTTSGQVSVACIHTPSLCTGKPPIVHGAFKEQFLLTL